MTQFTKISNDVNVAVKLPVCVEQKTMLSKFLPCRYWTIYLRFSPTCHRKTACQ